MFSNPLPGKIWKWSGEGAEAISPNDYNMITNQVTKDQVQALYLCNLPFRFQIKSQFKFNCPFKGNDVQIWIYNRVNPENLANPEDSVSLLESSRHPLFSEFGFGVSFSQLLIKVRTPQLTDQEFEGLRNLLPLFANWVVAVEAYNRLLMASFSINRDLFTGSMYIEKTSFLDFHLLTKRTDIIICEPDAELPRQFIDQLFTDLPPLHRSEFMGNIKYCEEASLKKVQDFLDRNYLERYLFYEFLFDAHTDRVRQQRQSALIKSAMALENIFYLLIEDAFKEKFDQMRNHFQTEKQELDLLSDTTLEEITDNFGRELGISNIVESFPYLFLKESEVLKPTEIRTIRKVLTTRNKLVHSKKTKADEYFWQIYSDQKLNLMIDLLSPILEKLIQWVHDRLG